MMYGKRDTKHSVHEMLYLTGVQKRLYIKCGAQLLSTGNVIRNLLYTENTVQEKVVRKSYSEDVVFYKCCTDNVVLGIMYRKCCTYSVVQKMLGWAEDVAR